MHLFKDIGSLMTLASLSQKDGRRPDVGDLSQQLRSAIIVHKGCIEWIGSQKNIPKEYRKKIKKETSLKNKTVMPAFVECHTHSIFAGNRSAEFEMRMRGQSYQEISAQGGGILSTCGQHERRLRPN
jgi:imidazolonepropionase